MAIDATKSVATLLSLQLSDGKTDKFPQAEIYTAAGALLSTEDLPHIAGGLYQKAFTFATVGDFDAQFITYKNAAHTTESGKHGRVSDRFVVSELVETEAAAAARHTIDIAEHDATQALIAGLPVPPTAAAIADAVLREVVNDHVATAGSLAEAIGVLRGFRIAYVLDGGAGATDIALDTKGLLTAGRIRIFSTPAAASTATFGAADAADGELVNINLVGNAAVAGTLQQMTMID